MVQCSRPGSIIRQDALLVAKVVYAPDERLRLGFHRVHRIPRCRPARGMGGDRKTPCMKKFMSCAAVGCVVFLISGYLFVNWANQPENVKAVLDQREKEAAQKIEDRKRQAEHDQQLAVKRAGLKLVIDETFDDNRLLSLDAESIKTQGFKLEDSHFKYTTLVTKGQNAYAFPVLSRESFEDFAAEIELDVWGDQAFVGLCWSSDSGVLQSAYSSPSRFYTELDSSDSFALGGLLASVNSQKIRVERFGSWMSASVNGEVYFEGLVEKAPRCKVGIYVAHGGGGEYPRSVSVIVKSFKVWR